MRARVSTLVASAGYIGFVPVAPGTFGSAVGLLIYAGIRATGSHLLEVVVLFAVILAGLWSAGRLEKELGKDPAAVVIDEVAGMLVTVVLLDVSTTGAVAGFFVFRVFDVIKPYPAGRLEHLPGGAGIMLDDLMAGVYSHLVLRLGIALFPGVLA